MSGIATAIVGSAAIGYFGSQNAANTEANAANNAANEQQQQFNTEQATEKPYVDAGNNALSQIQSNMSSYNQPFTMGQFKQDPGYQFDLQQGQQALNQSAAASGGIVSGSQMAALNNYSQNMASNEYQNAFNRYQSQIQNSYNRLAGIAQLGQGAAANTGAAAIQTGANVGNTMTQLGNAQAAGQMAGTNAISGAINQGLNYSMMSNLMQKPPTDTSPFNDSSSLTMPQIGSSMPQAPAPYGGANTFGGQSMAQQLGNL